MSRVITAMLFVMVFSAGLGFVAANNTFWKPQAYPQNSFNFTQMAQENISAWNPNLYSGLTSPFFFGDIIRGTMGFIFMVGSIVTLVPAIITIFPGFPVELAAILQVVIWFIYYTGFLEILTGRKF
jgi:hypothetical protein